MDAYDNVIGLIETWDVLKSGNVETNGMSMV